MGWTLDINDYPSQSEFVGFDNYAIFKKDILKKCTYNGILYLVPDYNSEDERCNHTLAIKDDKCLDDYGIRDFVNNLPKTSISLSKLQNNYKISFL